MGFEHVMTDEEVKAWEKRVCRYRKSKSVEDRIVAILMDSSIGKFGLNEQPSKEKAKAIWNLISDRR